MECLKFLPPEEYVDKNIKCQGGEGKNGDKKLRRTRIYYFCDKCVVLRVILKGWLAIAKLKPLSLFISLF